MNRIKLNPKELRRYRRQIMIPELQEAGQEKLKQARVVVVVGAGGLGCPALQYLAAAGIGTLGIIDDDIVDETNLYRQVSVFNYQGGPTYRCLFPRPPKEPEAPDPADIGVIGVLPGIIGTMQANEAIKIILEEGKVLSGKMWIIDLFNMQTYTVSIKTNPDNYSISRS